jgi:hypothetical protein
MPGCDASSQTASSFGRVSFHHPHWKYPGAHVLPASVPPHYLLFPVGHGKPIALIKFAQRGLQARRNLSKSSTWPTSARKPFMKPSSPVATSGHGSSRPPTWFRTKSLATCSRRISASTSTQVTWASYFSRRGQRQGWASGLSRVLAIHRCIYEPATAL